MSDKNSTEKSLTLEHPDRGTILAEERTSLALQRSFLASERTMMAWIRTSLSMIGFGFTLGKFFDYLQRDRQVTVRGPLGGVWTPEVVGLVLIGIGIFALIVAALQYKQSLRLLQREGLQKRWSLSLTVAALLGLLGILAFLGLIINQ